MFPKFDLFKSRRSRKDSQKVPVHYSPRSQVEVPRSWTTMQTLDERAGRIESHGALYCCACYKETTLVHIKGPHPFESLKCFQCRHVCCEKCYTTKILARTNLRGDQFVSLSQFTDKEVPYLTVCPHCGLSHRAKFTLNRRIADTVHLNFTDIRCPCGSVPMSKWLRLVIGTPDDWRTDKDECYMKAVMHRVENSVSSRSKSTGYIQENLGTNLEYWV